MRMKRLMGLTLFLALMVSKPSPAHEESAADFFRKDKEYWTLGLASPDVPLWAGSLNIHAVDVPKGADRQAVAKAVADEARKRLGPEHVDTALRITKLESGYRCHVLGPKTRHGQAVGPLQVLPSSAKALGVENLHRDCKAQITAGILHMERCLKAGAKTYRDMAACHVAGWGAWNKRLNKSAQKYREKYIRMAQASNVPAWAGTLR
jgi:hypothetical protein